MGDFATRIAKENTNAKFSDFGEIAAKRLPSSKDFQEAQNEKIVWNTNVHLLTDQIRNGRDSIWIYVLQNTSRPLVLRHRKFDVVIGNPPWIAYRYIQDRVYQSEIKKLTYDYGLLTPQEKQLTTQMELATLFFEHCRRSYLVPKGTIAFVMPRSVITPSKQHRAFQRQGFSHIFDLKGVKPLFNVETCVIIRKDNELYSQAIPTTQITGTLPAHECKLSEAEAFLTQEEKTLSFVDIQESAFSYYYSRVVNGAALYPRTLVFVTSAQPQLKSGQIAFTPIMHTDPDINTDAKEPWKGLELKGFLDETFLYATLLSKHLVPFGRGRLHLVALPLKVNSTNQITTLPNTPKERLFFYASLDEMHDNMDFIKSANGWFEPAEALWQKHKKGDTKESLFQWVNYQNKLIVQSAEPGFLVLYGATGTNLAAAVIDTRNLPVINGRQPQAFIVDHTTYWYRSSVLEEAYFLTAILNAPCVNDAIKAYQTRGQFGERHIHRRPFEVCAIPQFDPNNSNHLQLAALSRQSHELVSSMEESLKTIPGRKHIRQSVQQFIAPINEITQSLLTLPSRSAKASK